MAILKMKKKVAFSLVNVLDALDFNLEFIGFACNDQQGKLTYELKKAGPYEVLTLDVAGYSVDVLVTHKTALALSVGGYVSLLEKAAFVERLVIAFKLLAKDIWNENGWDVPSLFLDDEADPVQDKLSALDTLGDTSLKGAMDLIKKGQAPSAVTASTLAWPECTDTEIKTGQQVLLRDATRMYQPVKGTSPGTRYYMIGASKELRVAARWHSGKQHLSIRVEGPDLPKWKAVLAQSNFKVNADYASMHVHGDPVLMRKTMGSVLLALGTMETPIPDPERIVEA